jgi:hypothetical protein
MASVRDVLIAYRFSGFFGAEGCSGKRQKGAAMTAAPFALHILSHTYLQTAAAASATD